MYGLEHGAYTRCLLVYDDLRLPELRRHRSGYTSQSNHYPQCPHYQHQHYLTKHRAHHGITLTLAMYLHMCNDNTICNVEINNEYIYLFLMSIDIGLSTTNVVFCIHV